MHYKKYESERLYLSPISMEELPTYTKWMNDETLTRGLGTFLFNYTEKMEQAWLENNIARGEHTYSIIRKEDDKHIGNYGLELRSAVAKRFHIGGYIGDEEDRGKGYGTEALMLITKYAFEVLNANTLFSGVFSFNEASLKHAKKAGYTIAGRFREAYYYNGEYHDEICIEITREDYFKQKVK